MWSTYVSLGGKPKWFEASCNPPRPRASKACRGINQSTNPQSWGGFTPPLPLQWKPYPFPKAYTLTRNKTWHCSLSLLGTILFENPSISYFYHCSQFVVWERFNWKWKAFFQKWNKFHWLCLALASWALLGRSWNALKAILGCLEALLGRFWPILGHSWDVLGRSWGPLGRIFGRLGDILGDISKKSRGWYRFGPNFGIENGGQNQ